MIQIFSTHQILKVLKKMKVRFLPLSHGVHRVVFTEFPAALIGQ
jgi:hypothetical protein